MKKNIRVLSLVLALALLFCIGAAAFDEGDYETQFIGKWIDRESGREMEIKYTGSAFSVEITASGDKANTRLVWLITGLYNEETKRIEYDSCLWGIRTYTGEDQYTDSFDPSDETGHFTLVETQVLWYYEFPQGDELLVFDRVSEAQSGDPTENPADKPDLTPTASQKIPFTDVKESDYFYQAVVWCYANNITKGVSETEFDPQGTVTRAQVVCFLWRMAGEPAPKHSDMVFVDVEIGSWYEKAVQWAVAEGITVGTGEGCFSPYMNCTRGQVITFLHRMLGEPKPYGLGAYIDVPANEYYAAAVNWATENGVITEPTKGTKKDTFVPNGDARRKDMIVFLYEASKLSADDVQPGKPEPVKEPEKHPYEDFLGTWAEQIAGRGVVTFSEYGGGNYLVSVSWGDSAATTYFWSIFAWYDAETGRVDYSDARKWHRTYQSETEYVDETDYTGGVGYFSIEGGKLVWINDKGDIDKDARFVKLEA